VDSLDVVELFFAALLIVFMGTLWRLDRAERAEAVRKRVAAKHTVDESALR
jgi:hypothetical protein